MSTTIAGIKIPDSRLAREATDLVRDTETDLLFHHSRRVFLFGALSGDRKGLFYDPELLYIGAMFHDMGLVKPYSSDSERFEVDGANAAGDFLRRHGIAEASIELVWDAIALHTTPGIPQHKKAEVALVTAGVEMDVLGLGFPNVSDAHRADVVSARRAVQAGHRRSLLPGHQAQAPYDLRQRQGRCARTEGSAFPSRQFLPRHPGLGLAELMRVLAIGARVFPLPLREGARGRGAVDVAADGAVACTQVRASKLQGEVKN